MKGAIDIAEYNAWIDDLFLNVTAGRASATSLPPQR